MNNHQGLDYLLELRKVIKDDSNFIFKLRNDPSVRQASFNSEIINVAVHEKWLDQQLESENCLFLIVEFKGQPAGQIRFDINLIEKSAEVNISILPTFRNKGLGTKILEMGCKRAFEIFHIEKFHAFIKKENIGSIKAFSKAGFITKGHSVLKGHDSIRMKLEIDVT